MLQSQYLTEIELADFGFKHIGSNIKISQDARVYDPQNVSIGNNVRIDDFAILSASNGWIEIGDHIQICHNSHLAGANGITIMDFSSMAANTIIYSSSDDYSGDYLTSQVLPKQYTNDLGGPVIIGQHTIIGAGCTILGGVNIGEGCSIGAMSLILKDLDPWGIYVGVPARKLKDRNKQLLKLKEEFLANYHLIK